MDETGEWIEGKDLRRGLEAYRERLLASPAAKLRRLRTTFLDTDTKERGFPMFIAMNRFRVAKGSEADFEQVWLSRDSHLDKVPGFVEFHLL